MKILICEEESCKGRVHGCRNGNNFKYCDICSIAKNCIVKGSPYLPKVVQTCMRCA